MFFAGDLRHNPPRPVPQASTRRKRSASKCFRQSDKDGRFSRSIRRIPQATESGRREEREAVAKFIEAARTGNRELLASILEFLELQGLFERAFREVAKYSAPMHLRASFAHPWVASGDSIRNQVNNDFVLIDGLRHFCRLMLAVPSGFIAATAHETADVAPAGFQTSIDVARAYADGIWADN